MKIKEVTDLTGVYPLLSTVLRIISQGKIIREEDPMWPTYLIARQRGLVQRIGDRKEIIDVSPRGVDFLDMAKK